MKKENFDWKVHVEHIDEFGKRLSDWEKKFIEDMLNREKEPSEKQIEIIKRIYDEKCC